MTDISLIRRVKRIGWIGWAVIAVLVAGSAVATAAAGGNGNGNNGNGNGNGGPGNPGHQITVTGTSPTGLAPGLTKPVTVTVKNANGDAVRVTSVVITVGDASTACPAAGNIAVTNYDSTKKGALTYTAAKNGGSVQVPLTISMLDTKSNQDTCKSQSFPLKFTATVTSTS